MISPTDSIHRLADAAATRAEAALSGARLLFCVAMLLRFLSMEESWGDADGLTRSLLVIPGTLAATAYSAGAIAWWWRGRLVPLQALWVSVSLDILIGVLALASNGLFPGDGYRGILSGPDLAVLVMLVAASGLRLSPGVTLLGGGLAVAGAAALVLVDAILCPVPVRNHPVEASLWAVVFLGTTAVAWMAAWQTRRLLESSVLAAGRLARTREVLGALRGVHHDAHSGVGALTLASDRLLRALAAGRSTEVRRIGADLREQVDFVSACLREVQEGADGELHLQRTAEIASVGEALAEARRQVAALPLEVTADGALDALAVQVTGGQAGLVRILVNLLRNAAEGDGERGAGRAAVSGAVEAGQVVIRVVDDGPGLGGAKPGGHGVGLQVVRTLVEGAGGAFVLSPTEGGARAEVRLPAASAVEAAALSG